MLATMVSDDGRLDLELPEVPERHKTRSRALPSWNGVIAGSRLVGRDDLSAAALDASARQCGTGLRRPDRSLAAGAQAFGGHMIIRWSAPLSTAQLNLRGYVPPTGPVLDAVADDHVLVVMARSVDGTALDLVLEPWQDVPAGPISLDFRQLDPGTTYALAVDRVPHGTIRADDAGRGTVRLTVASGRVVVRLEPAASTETGEGADTAGPAADGGAW